MSPIEKGPQKIVSTGNSFEITNPILKRRAMLKLTPNWDSGSVQIVSFGLSKEERLQLESKFTELARTYISAEIKNKAAKQIQTTDAIGPDMDAMDASETLFKTVDEMKERGFSEKEIQTMLGTQGQLFRGAGAPSMIQEIVSGFSAAYEERKANQKNKKK